MTVLCELNNKSLSFLSVVFIFLYYLAFNFSLGPIVWLYCSEILPSKGISIATMFNWLSGALMVFVVPYFLNSLWILFLVYTLVCIGSVGFILIFVKETKGKSKMEIQKMFIPSDAILKERNDIHYSKSYEKVD